MRDFAAEIEAKRAEYRDLTRKIGGLPGGSARLELKRQRFAVEAEAVVLRQKWIEYELTQPNPKQPPRVSFGEERIRNVAPPGQSESEFEE